MRDYIEDDEYDDEVDDCLDDEACPAEPEPVDFRRESAGVGRWDMSNPTRLLRNKGRRAEPMADRGVLKGRP